MAITRIGNPALADVREPNFRNIIINGDMSQAQRGTSFAAANDDDYTLDRFKYDISGTDVYQFTISQDTDVPTGQGFAKSMKFDCTTADASLDADNFAIIHTKIEGQNLQYLKKGTSNAESTTLSFWVKSNKTGTYIAELQDEDNNRVICKSYTVSSSSTWEKKTITFAGDTTGTLDNDNAVSLALQFWFTAGSNFTSGTLNTSWNSVTNANRAVGQVNNADSTSNNVHITGLQLEVGEYTSSTIPPFQHESFGDSLARCQRYFQMRAEGNQKIISIAHWGSSNEVDFIMEIPFMRTRPSVEYTTGNEYWAIGGGGSTNTLDNLNMNSWSTEMNINLWTTTGAGGTTGFAYYGYSNNASAKLGFTAEL